jgi:hypothetical protein
MEQVGGMDEGIKFWLSVSEIPQGMFKIPYNLTTGAGLAQSV